MKPLKTKGDVRNLGWVGRHGGQLRTLAKYCFVEFIQPVAVSLVLWVLALTSIYLLVAFFTWPWPLAVIAAFATLGCVALAIPLLLRALRYGYGYVRSLQAHTSKSPSVRASTATSR
jgi:hypothetical protein